MEKKNKIDSYDQIKTMLKKIRSIQDTVKLNYGIIREQEDDSIKDNEDINVINGVDVVIQSEDQMDLTLNDDEKNKISQLIDDFRSEISEVAEFDKLQIYSNSVKLSGSINGLSLDFTFSSGDDIGLYITSSLLKIDDSSLVVINNLKTFENKFSDVFNSILSVRKGN